MPRQDRIQKFENGRISGARQGKNVRAIPDLPTIKNITIATFTNGTTLLSIYNAGILALQDLQEHLDVLQNCFGEWKIKIDETKFVQNAKYSFFNYTQIPVG